MWYGCTLKVPAVKGFMCTSSVAEPSAHYPLPSFPLPSCGAYAMGNPLPIDNCVASENRCNGTAGRLPKCSGTVYAMGGGPGTIMSYCDQLGPYYIKNVALTFGVSRWPRSK